MDWSLSAVAPELVLVVAALIIMLVELPLRRRASALPIGEALAIGGILIAGALVFGQWGDAPGLAFGGRLILDPMSQFLRGIFLVAGLGTLLMGLPYLGREGLPKLEFLVLVLFAMVGMMLMGAAGEMITLFLALELLSMALYVLAGYQRGQARSVESSLKYFLLGAFASAILLMGMALHWGSTGSLQLTALADPAGAVALSPAYARAGFWLIVVGLAFKISAVPFHFWTADVYEGAPAPVTAFMTTGTKAAALAVLVRLLLAGFAPEREVWLPVLWWLAVLTMSVGNLMAIVQANIKRMLAFSSVAHAGYLLVAIVAGRSTATRALLFYLVAYTLMNLGAFAVVSLVGRKGERFQQIYDYAGLARRQPWLAALMGVFLFSLAGIPPTVGFTGKFFIFGEAVRAGFVGLAVIAVLNSLISVYYYLRVVYLMFMKEEWEESPDFGVPLPAALLLGVCLLLVLYLGLFPAGLLEAAGYAARLF